MNSSFDHVISSYHRARGTATFFDTFYRLFLGKSPDIPPMFARTDFPHQKLMLRESIVELLSFAQTGKSRAEIERLGERHRELHVTERHYQLWLEALSEALSTHDPEFTPELADMWRQVLSPGIKVMQHGP